MLRPLVALALLALPAAAPAADRRAFVSSFDRIRVEGPFRVAVTTGKSPGATVSGDPRVLDGVEVRQDGTTLVVRRSLSRWEEQPRVAAATPVTIALGTPSLTSVTVIGGGAVAIAGMKGTQLDLAVSGAGSIAVAGAAATRLNATSVGAGVITVAGRADTARLSINGAGAIHAEGLEAGEAVVRVDGPGEAAVKARYTAQVTNTGLGRVVITGSPKCQVKADAGGPVTCGAGR